MRARNLAVVGTAVLMIAGCSSGGDAPAAKVALPDCAHQNDVRIEDQAAWLKRCIDTNPPTSTALPDVDCNDPDLGPQLRWAACGDKPDVDEPAPADVLQIGQPALITSTNPSEPGTVEITPVAVVYLAQSGSTRAKSGVFLTIGLKIRAVTGSPDPSGQWTLITADGQSIRDGGGNSYNVVPETFNGGGDLLPGTFKYTSETWDIAEQQRGGTIAYTAGSGAVSQWQLPAQDAGPDAAKLKAELV